MRRRRRLATTLTVAALLAGAAVAVPYFMHRYGDEYFSNARCTVTVAGESDTLTGEQANNAALIAVASIRRHLPPEAATIALATAIQESDLRNLDYGDRDSLGLFQQRPSQGWGEPEEVRDPQYATKKFYNALGRVEGWRDMTVTEAAQAVQRSGFPEAYADHEGEARLWATALTGGGGIDAIECRLPGPEPGDDALAEFTDRVAADFGERVAVTVVPAVEGGSGADGEAGDTGEVGAAGEAGAGAAGSVTVLLDYPGDAPTAQDAAVRDAAANWAVAVAAEYPVERVAWCYAEWTRERGTWEFAEDADVRDCPPTGVWITLAVAE